MIRQKTRYPGVMYRLNAAGERRYQIAYRDSNGKRVFKTVDGNEKDALRKRNEILERMHRGGKVVNSKLTVEELAEDYLRTQTSHLKSSTLKTYGYSIDQWILPRLGDRKVSEVQVEDIADFIAEMRQDHSAWTIRGCLTPLSRMFTYAIRKGHASSNPVTSLDRNERPKGLGRSMRVLDTEEIGALLRASSDNWRPLFTAAIFSGLRISELLDLQWSEVDFTKSIIRVKSSKTDAGVREVVIPDFLLQKLAEISLVREPNHYVFGTANGTKLSERRNVNRALTATLERAGIPHARFHDLRHTFASILISQGLDVTYVADQMGHASPKITLGIYAKVFDPKQRRQEARERLQESFEAMMAR